MTRPFERLDLVVRSNYLDMVDRFALGDREAWCDLADQLIGRPGWRAEVANGDELMWSFGSFGSSLLNISWVEDAADERVGWNCFDYFMDDETILPSVQGAVSWAEDRQEAARQRDTGSRDMLISDQFRLFKGYTFDAQVDWADGTFIATVEKMSEPASFAESLHAVLVATRSMLVAFVGGPADLEGQVKLRAHLSVDAASRVASP